MAARRKSDQRKAVVKIKKYRRPMNLNIGMIIFVALFFYLIICVILYFKTGHITRYEVQEGSLAVNNIYRAVAIREETVVNAQNAGYINYYAREGERVGVGNLVYAVDETGRLNEYLEGLNQGTNALSSKALAEFRSEIVNFMHGFDERNYSSTYDFKFSLKNMVLRLAGNNMLQSINDMSGAGGAANIVKFCYAPITGVISYWTDGYEGLTADAVTSEVFNGQYEKKALKSNELVASGSPAYKVCTGENWSIVIPMDAQRCSELLEEGYIKVRFLKNQYESWGKAAVWNNGDGNSYLQLSFTNSMISFVSERFLDVELILNDIKGLKIPKSSIVEKEFFLVPDAFVTTEEKGGKNGIYRQKYLEDGSISTEFVAADFYSHDDQAQKYYLDNSILEPGTILHKLDSQETFVVSERATLQGVYHMNRGYADFKEIRILYQNEEYAIVKANTQYGLSVYDYIALDADKVSDDQFISDVNE